VTAWSEVTRASAIRAAHSRIPAPVAAIPIALGRPPYQGALEWSVRRCGEAATEYDVLAGAEALDLYSGSLDLLVVGSRGYGPVGRLVHGSTSQRLVGIEAARTIARPNANRGHSSMAAAADHHPGALAAGHGLITDVLKRATFHDGVKITGRRDRDAGRGDCLLSFLMWWIRNRGDSCSYVDPG